MKEIFFQSHPDVTIGGNVFRNTPVILQFEQTPLLEVVKFEPAGYSARFPIYHSDGTRLAVVAGNQIHLTKDGEKSNIKRRCEPDLTVCELGGKPILELRRKGAAALHGWAELYAPDGVLIKATDSEVSGLLRSGEAMVFGGMVLRDSFFDGCRIGIHFSKNGCGVGLGGSVMIGHMRIGHIP